MAFTTIPGSGSNATTLADPPGLILLLLVQNPTSSLVLKNLQTASASVVLQHAPITRLKADRVQTPLHSTQILFRTVS